jgi:TetR/AcrR family transcriptional regulator
MKASVPARAKPSARPRPKVVRKALRPGRPVVESNVERRGLLLDVTLELFASQGIAGTSLNAIAQKANVTPALVHYYFGNKEKLVDVVINERLLPLMVEIIKPLDMEESDPLQAIQTLAQWMIDITTATPWLSALWVREVLSEGGQLREWILENIAVQMNEKLGKLVIAAQKKGQLNKKLDPRLVIVSLIGLTLFPLAGAPIWQKLPGNKNISTEDLSRHMLELFAHGVEV